MLQPPRRAGVPSKLASQRYDGQAPGALGFDDMLVGDSVHSQTAATARGGASGNEIALGG
jgi:hypothetical protein